MVFLVLIEYWVLIVERFILECVLLFVSEMFFLIWMKDGRLFDRRFVFLNVLFRDRLIVFDFFILFDEGCYICVF